MRPMPPTHGYLLWQGAEIVMTVLFNETEHTYRRDGKLYQSVGEFLKKFKPPFPKGYLAEKCAPKQGLTPDEVIAKWDLNAEVSTLYGNAIHKGIEYWIRYGEVSKLPHIQRAVEKFAEKFDRSRLVSELIVFSDEYLLAGTMDVVLKTGPKQVRILDIKTNGELTDKAKGKFLPPLQTLPFSKLNEYRLQLSTYKHLMELKGLTVEAIELEHWNGDTFTTIGLEPIDITPLLPKS